MNKEALVTEINGQTAKLLELYTKKEIALKNIEKQKVEINELEIAIRETRGILETLRFTLQTDGFTNLPETREQVQMPANTTMDEVTKALRRG